MKKLIKADLCNILRLTPTYLPVLPESIDRAINALCQCKQTDYLFLIRREKSYLFDVPAVYTPDSYEYLAWTYPAPLCQAPTRALLLHVADVLEQRPIGSVSMLDYPATVKDVELFSALPAQERERHIKYLLKHSGRKGKLCTILEVIQYLKTGRS